MSKKQLKHNIKVEGGFLGVLAGIAARALPMLAKAAAKSAVRAIPAIGKTAVKALPHLGLEVLSGLADHAIKKRMGSGLYLKKGGLVSQVETDGQGLYLKPYNGRGLSSYENGLYLKQRGKIYDGRGLIFGPNSPFSKITILGALL